MSDADRLQQFIDTWWAVVTENVAFLRTLEPGDWDKPTDLPGWDVRFVAAHLAHLESVLAGNPQREVEVAPAQHIKGAMNVFTESGPLARADWSTDQIIDEIESSAAKRRDDLAALMPIDPTAIGDGFAAVTGWTWATLLSNRPVDQWMHQQDIRRAINRPGGLDGVGATHALNVFLGGLPFVVGKRVSPPAGTSVAVRVTGAQEAARTVVVNDDGRAATLDASPEDPTTTLTMDFETFIVLSGGRRDPADVSVDIQGDEALAASVLANLSVTP